MCQSIKKNFFAFTVDPKKPVCNILMRKAEIEIFFVLTNMIKHIVL